MDASIPQVTPLYACTHESTEPRKRLIKMNPVIHPGGRCLIFSHLSICCHANCLTFWHPPTLLTLSWFLPCETHPLDESTADFHGLQSPITPLCGMSGLTITRRTPPITKVAHSNFLNLQPYTPLRAVRGVA